MDADRMRRIQDLFAAALERPPELRAAFLHEAAGADAELRVEVESLLEHDSQAGAEFLRPVDPRDRSRAWPRSGAGRVTTPIDPLDASAAPVTPRIRRQDETMQPLEIAGYEITQELGRGGQGVVYRAVQKATKREVAIKVLLAGPFAAPAAQRRFEREIELVAQLRHPSIISIFHSDVTSDGHPYYVMDFVSGRPLKEYVRLKALSLEETLALFLTICEAVQHAHQKGVLHRDLKPTNIVVDENSTPRILDFGLAKPLRATEENLISVGKEIIGTLAYMSPEQAAGDGDETDTRADVYSLGVILYELLCGRRPYSTDGTFADVLRQIAETPPLPPRRNWNVDAGVARRSERRGRSEKCPIDGELETIVLKALAKERERRYQSVGDLIRDLRHYQRGEPIEARGDSLAYVLWKQSRRLFRQAPIAGLILLCAILAPGLLTALVFWRQAVHERDVAAAAISFLNNDVFQRLDPEMAGRDVDLRELLDAASARIGERFADAPLAEASIRLTLGNFYGSLGENARALEHLEQALRLRRAALGDRHLAVAEALLSVSRVLENLGRDKEAEEDLREGLAIRSVLLGENDPLVVATVEQLAAFARRQGNLELVALLMPRAGESGNSAKVTNGRSPVATPAATEPAADASAARVDRLRDRVRQARHSHGSSHPIVAQRLSDLADELVSAGRAAEAEPYFEEALAIWTNQLGSEHIRARDVFSKLEDLLFQTGQHEKLERLLVERLNLALAADNPLALSSAAWDVVKRTGYPADLYERALTAARRACALQPENGAFLNTLGVTLYRTRCYEEARVTLLRSDKLNDDHPADIAFLAMSLSRVDRTDDARRELERLRELMRQRPWAADPQSLRFLHEAETLIEGG